MLRNQEYNDVTDISQRGEVRHRFCVTTDFGALSNCTPHSFCISSSCRGE